MTQAADADNVDRGDDFVPTDEDLEKEDVKADADAADVKADDKKVDADDEKKADDKKVDADDDKAEDKKEDKKEKRVPESRLTEVVRKAKDREEKLAARIKELEAAVSNTKVSADIEEVETKIDELQDAYEDAIADNNKAKAKEVRGKIRSYERQLIDLKASEKAMAAKAETIEELRYEAAIAKVEQDYPQINPDAEDFNEDVAGEVLDLRNSLMKNGVSAAKALQRAVKYVLGEPASAKSKEDIDSARDKRAVDARQKAADASKRQPADTTRLGLDSDKAGKTPDKIDVAKMSQERFSKLDEETLSRLRGDTL